LGHITVRPTVPLFLKLLGAIYFIAFISFGVQAQGLIGSHGILPVADYLKGAQAGAGRAAYRLIPTLLWISTNDAAITAVWLGGAIAAAVAAWGFRPRIALVCCLVLWLSICAAGQDFLSFQWDVLLLEAGFLAIFADPSFWRILLFRWLLFRLMFFSGMVKLLSHDRLWRNLTALHYHYETQPLPNPVAWLMYQLPMLFQRASTAFTLAVEIGVPFLFFAPARPRRIGAWMTIALQLLIIATGNYTFFKFLTIALAMFLFIEPTLQNTGKRHKAVTAVLGTFVLSISGLLFLELFSVPLPAFGSAMLHAVAPLRIVNSYGLFAVMTDVRDEIVVEGSNDGSTWQAYEFRYKPGDVLRAPPVVAPHQPRLDWQMWFAALSNYQQNPWFVNLMVRLLEGQPVVLRLLASNPFPQAPPKYIRARLYLYHFTHFGDRGWWTREERGMYFPAVSLK
jgi:hypothetical protein